MIVNDFEIIDNRIIKYVGNGGVVTLPEGCTYIDETAFMDLSDPNSVDYSPKSTITKVIISTSLTDLNDAFWEMPNLQEVIFKQPCSITRIDNMGFSHCDKLEVLNLPSSVEYIGDQALAACSNLRKVSVGKNCKINPNAFLGSDKVSLAYPSDYQYESSIPSSLKKPAANSFSSNSYSTSQYNSSSSYQGSSNDTNEVSIPIVFHIFIAVAIAILWILTFKLQVLHAIAIIVGVINIIIAVYKYLK